MPNFFYSAKNLAGETKAGSREAASEADLARTLREQGLVLTSVKKIEESAKKNNFLADFISNFGGVPLAEKMLFARHLAVMIGAGLSLNRALDILALQTNSKKLTKVLRIISEDINKGQTFSDSLAKYPTIFSGLFVSMVRVGETGGNLEEILKLLAEQMKKDHTLRSSVRSAMIYPSVILVAMIGIGITMMIVVVPKLSSIFSDMKMELPYSTRLIIFISNFLSQHIFISAIIIIFIGASFPFAARNKNIKKIIDAIILKLPVFSDISKKINSARFARTLGSLIEGGIPIVRGLQIVSETLTNYYFRVSLANAAEEIQKGKTLSKILKDYPHLYPPLVEQMIGVGEETGTTGDILKRLAEFYEEEVTNLTKGLASVIEPILMIIIGAAVGFFAISMLQPMYSMMEGL
ncbi:MAG: Type II secretion system F domain protein [Parcubacteria group bacterium GW2011_GWA2_42_11]|nr:MAG: Type II secretion system F domain protein [Parcubacteria group bacterium GW2011_GWA2_42_11]